MNRLTHSLIIAVAGGLLMFAAWAKVPVTFRASEPAAGASAPVLVRTNGVGDWSGGITSISATGFTVDGADRAIVVGVYAVGALVSMVKWDPAGVNESLTLLAESSSQTRQIYTLVNPSTGTGSIEVTMAAAANSVVVVVGLLNGAHQSDTFGAVSDLHNTSATTTGVSVASPANSLVLGWIFSQVNDVDADSPGVMAKKVTDVSDSTLVGLAWWAVSGDPTAISFTQGSSGGMHVFGFAVKPL
jgi:hypothetical protein